FSTRSSIPGSGSRKGLAQTARSLPAPLHVQGTRSPDSAPHVRCPSRPRRARHFRTRSLLAWSPRCAGQAGFAPRSLRCALTPRGAWASSVWLAALRRFGLLLVAVGGSAALLGLILGALAAASI